MQYRDLLDGRNTIEMETAVAFHAGGDDGDTDGGAV